MDPTLTQLLDEILGEAEAGVQVTPRWLASRYPRDAAELIEHLRLVGLVQPDQEPPARIGPFRVIHELGRGGMGVVYLAEAVESLDGVKTGERVALKVIHRHLLDDERVRKRFLMEGLAGSRVQHPNVVRTISACRIPTNGHHEHCLLMDFVEGPTLLELRRADVMTPEPLLLHVAQDVTAALCAIHARGIVHCDVKPQNIIFTKDASFCLADLGIANIAEASSVGTAVSPLYAAPEQLLADVRVDGRADLFALGRTLYHLATGKPPRRDELATLPSDYSAFLREVVRCLTQADRENRFESAEQLQEVLTAGELSTWWQDHAAYQEEHAGSRTEAGYLHGRQTELARLTEVLALANARRGQTVLVEGPAGIGKSRLVASFHRSHAAAVLASGFQPETGAPTAPAIRRALSAAPGLQAALSSLTEDHGALLARWLRGEPGAVDSYALECAVVSLLQKLTQTTTCVLQIEDIHLAEPRDLDLLRSISSRSEQMRLMLVLTARPALDAELRMRILSLHHASSVCLEALGEEDTTALVVDACHPRRLSLGLQRAIVASSAGNPLHALALVADALTHKGLQRRADGSWALPRQALSELGKSLDELIASAVRALPGPARSILQQLACCGAVVDGRVAESLASKGSAPLINDLVAADWLLQTADGYRFAHHRVHEVVYAGMDPIARGDVHRRLVDLLPSMGIIDTVTLCRNALRGNRAEVVRDNIVSAIKQMIATQRHRAAVDLATEALAIPDLIEGAHRLHVVHAVDAAWTALSVTRRDLPLIVEYRDLADALGEVEHGCLARLLLSWSALRYQEYDEALSHLRSASMRLEGHGLSELEARVQRTWGYVERFREDWDAEEEIAHRATEYARRTGDPIALVESSQALGNVAIARGDFEAAARHYADASERAHATPGQEVSRMLAEGHRALIAYLCGDFVAAKRSMTQCQSLAEPMSDVRTRGIVKGTWGFMSAAEGCWEKAIADLQAGLSDVLDVDDGYEAGVQLIGLGALHFGVGDIPLARNYYDEAAAVSKRVGSALHIALVSIHSDWLSLRSSGDQEAIARVRATFDRYGIDTQNAGVLIAWAEALAVHGFEDEATHCFTRSWAVLPNMGELNWMRAWADCWLGWLSDDARGYGVSMLSNHPDRVPLPQRVGMHFATWAATDESQHLERARDALKTLAAQSPEAYRVSMLEQVPLYQLVMSGQRPNRQ